MWVLYNINTDTKFKITKTEYVGRNKEALIMSQDPSVSRMHAKLTLSPSNLLQVQDLKSSNGTFVNTERIKPMAIVIVNLGDVIAFGNINANVRALTPLIFKVMQTSENMDMDVINLCSDEEPIEENNDDKSSDENKSVITDKVVNGNPAELVPLEIKSNPAAVKSTNLDTNCLPSNKDAKNVEETTKNDEKKQESEECNTSASNKFSITSDVIVISDDENDGDLLGCSQIFKLDQQIKRELEECPDKDNNEDFLAIKQELEYMDEIQEDEVIVNKVPINLEQEFLNTQDLCNVLEYQPESQLNPYNDTLNMPLNNNKVEENDDQKKKSKKYVKPPIVEPHSMVKIQKDDKTHEKPIEKRKSPPKSNKKRRTSLSDASKSKKHKPNHDSSKNANDSKEQSKNNDLKALKEERKRKLKELSKKDSLKTISVKSTTATKPIIPAKKPHVPVDSLKKPIPNQNLNVLEPDQKSKLSKSVTKIKTLQAPSVSPKSLKRTVETKVKTLQAPSIPLKPPGANQKTKPLKRTVETKIKTPEINSLAPSVSHQKPSSSETLVKTKLKAESSLNPSIQPIAGPSKVVLHRIPIKSNNTNNQYSSEDAVMPLNITHTFVPNLPIVDFYSIDIVEVYNKITNWKANWFEEQKNCSHSPPINGRTENKVMSRYFESYDDYYNTITLLVYLELWHQLYDALYKNEQSSPTIAQILHTRIVGELVYIDCVCYMDEESSKKGQSIRQYDTGLLEIKFKNKNGENLKFTGLTVVTQCKQIYLKPDSTIHELAASCIKNVPYTEYKFTLVMKYLPDSMRFDGLVVIKLFTNIGTPIRLIRTIKYLRHNKKLCNLIIKPNPNDYFIKESSLNMKITNKTLNQKQQQIVKEACEVVIGKHYGFYLIKGPPGTGKSTVIINIISELLLQLNCSYSILLTAPSNAAVDALILKIMDFRRTLTEADKKKIRLVRIGPFQSILKSVQNMSLSSITTNSMINGFPQAKNQEAGMGMFDETYLRKMLGSAYNYERTKAEERVLFSANIITTTLNSCIFYKLLNGIKSGKMRFMCCIVDEATQANELETLQPIVMGIEKFILVGDPQQLSATVCNKEAKDLNYGKSLFTRIADNFESIPYASNPIRMLEEQYRMDPKICSFPNKHFYQNRLKSIPNKCNKIVPTLQPYLVFNIRDATNTNDNYFNQIEVEFIHNLLDLICKRVDERCQFSIGIITPYTAQREAIDHNLKGIDSLKKPNITYTVNTVDSFQGRENDIIVISCVRESPNIFLKNENRLNVALTRAKQALYIIGNYNLFKHTKILYDLREDAKQRQLCIDVQNVTKEFFQFLNDYIFIK